MAERLKVKLLDSDRLVDLVAGPDAYRDIPRLLDTIEVTLPCATILTVVNQQCQHLYILNECAHAGQLPGGVLAEAADDVLPMVFLHSWCCHGAGPYKH